MNTPASPAAAPVYDLAFFRQLFESRPESSWTCWARDNGEGQYCALGHVGEAANWCRTCDGRALHFGDTDMTLPLCELFTPLGDAQYLSSERSIRTGRIGCGMFAVAAVNNGIHPDYQQSTPKARILAAIDDLIAMEEAKRAAELDAVETRTLVPVSRPAAAPAAVESPLLVEASS